MIYVTIICVALAALLAWRERLAARERREAALERAALAQRIQAPRAAVAEHARAHDRPRPRPRPIAENDDARYGPRAPEDGR